MTIDNALPGLELDCAPDPCCPIDCEACADLPYGESVRKGQLSLMTTSIHAQEIFTRIMSGPSLTVGSPDVELMTMAMGAIHLASFASVIGLLLKEDPKLAHRAIAIHQDMYSNGDIWFTEQLYSDAEKLHAEHVAKRAERLAAIEPAYLIWCRSDECWWKPRAAGYTVDIWRAGRFTKAEAESKTFHQPNHVAVLAPEGGCKSFTIAELAGVAETMQERREAAVKARMTAITPSEVL